MAVARYSPFSAGRFPNFGPNPTGNLPLFAFMPGGWAERWPQTFPPAVPPDEYEPLVSPAGDYAGWGETSDPSRLATFISSVGSKIGTGGKSVLTALQNMDPETASNWIDTVGQGYLTVSQIRANVQSANSPASRRRGNRRRRQPAAPQPDPRVDEIQAQIAQLAQAMQAQQAPPARPAWLLPAAIGGGALLLVVALMAGRRAPAPRRSYDAPRR
jgi:hypothetical protein